MQVEVARQATNITSLLQHQKAIEAETKEQTKIIEKLKAQKQVDVVRQFAHGASLCRELQELNKMVEMFESPSPNDLVSLTKTYTLPRLNPTSHAALVCVRTRVEQTDRSIGRAGE